MRKVAKLRSLMPVKSDSPIRPRRLFRRDSTRIGVLSVGCALAVIGHGPSVRAEVTAQVTRIDGSTERGVWLGVDSNGLRIEGAADGAIPLDELESVRFREQQPATGDGLVVLHLGDGGRLAAELIRSEGTSVLVNTGIGESLSIPFEALAAIQFVASQQFEKAADIFEAVLADRPPGKDVLITRDRDEVKSVQGRLEAIDPVSGSFHFGDRVRSFQTEKMFGVVFAKLARDEEPAPAFLTLSDGARLSGKIIRSDAESMLLAATCCGEVVVALDRLVRIDYRSDRVVYLSDLTPKSQKSQGRLHEPSPVRLNQSVAAGPMLLDGQRFDRGVGVHSRTELTYTLDGKYESFVAMVGIDDSARPLGSVAFRVVGDGQTLFESETLTGRDRAELVSVRVRGIKELTLIADFGDEVDLADLANWGGARLIKLRRR